MNKNSGVLIAVGAVFLAVVLTVTTVANASRNSSGTMSAINGPYVPGTAISSSIINSRFADIEAELTDSLSRSGKGGMTAALKEADGTAAAPSFSFTNEAGTGWYRIGAGDLGLAILGTKKLELTSSLFTVTPNASFSGTLGLTGAATLSSTLGVTGDFAVNTSKFTVTASNGTIGIAGATNFSTGNVHMLQSGSVYGTFAGLWAAANADSPSTTNYTLLGNATTTALNVPTGGTIQFNVQDVTKASLNGSGLIIGSGGTAISKTLRGTVVASPGTIAANTCDTSSGLMTLTGAAAGAECAAGVSGSMVAGVSITCAVAADSCAVILCNVTTSGKAVTASMTYSCRVFNP